MLRGGPEATHRDPRGQGGSHLFFFIFLFLFWPLPSILKICTGARARRPCTAGFCLCGRMAASPHASRWSSAATSLGGTRVGALVNCVAGMCVARANARAHTVHAIRAAMQGSELRHSHQFAAGLTPARRNPGRRCGSGDPAAACSYFVQRTNALHWAVRLPAGCSQGLFQVWIQAMSKHSKLLVAGKCVAGKSLLKDKDSIQIHDRVFHFHARVHIHTSQSKVTVEPILVGIGARMQYSVLRKRASLRGQWR